MLRLSLSLALVLLALAPSAQTSHIEVVDAVIEAADLDRIMDEMVGPMLQNLPGAPGDLFDTAAIEAMLRARFIADGQTDDLRAVLAYYTSPTHAVMLARGQEMVDEMSDPEGLQAFQQRVADLQAGTLADDRLAAEALVRRYQIAQGMTEMIAEMMPRMFQAMADASPQFAAMLDAQGGIEVVTSQLNGENLDEITDAQVASMRVAYYSIPRNVLVQAVEFAESEPGRYFTRVSSEVTMDVMIPAAADFMARMISGFEAPVDDAEIEILEVPDGNSPADGVETVDVAEVPPTLIGGPGSIAPEYPEDARRAGIEGRVIVQFVVDERGEVADARVVRSPNDLLSEAALAEVRTLRFTPGMDQGRPVKVRFAVPITFRLRDDLEGSGPPITSLPQATEVFEVADTPAAIVGGMAALMNAVVYPADAIADDVRGRVMVRLVVRADGEVTDLVVLSSPDPRLSAAAVEAIGRVTFEPARQRDRAVANRLVVPVVFQLVSE